MRGYIPDLLSVILGNMLAVGTTALALEGNRRFLQLKRKSNVPVAIMGVYVLTLIYQTYISPSVTKPHYCGVDHFIDPDIF